MTSSPDRVEAPTRRSRFVRRFWITLTALTVFLYAVIVIPLWRIDYQERSYIASLHAFTGHLDDVPLTRARGDALALQLDLYEALSDAGAGEWTAPAVGSPSYQAYRETWMTCPRGSASEIYDLASAAHLTDRDAALAAVTPIVEAAGFVVPSQNLTNLPGATFYRPRDDAAVSVRFGAVTSVVVSTGCHRGSAFEDWPDGADVVPDHLRTTGRAPAAGGGRWNGR